MHFHSLYSSIRAPIETCVIGSGGFGQSFMAQAQHVRLMNARIAVDRDAATAARALALSGIAPDRIRICADARAARAAWHDGSYVAADSLAAVIDLPFQVLVEATGHPEAAAGHALAAIEAGRHVALVSKETDSVCGPGLARLARERGLVVTPVDGDQPSLLIGLVTWAEVLGLPVVAAGKSSEYDFVFDRAAGTLTSNGVVRPLAGLAEAWSPGKADADAGAAAALRARIVGSAFPLRAVPDLCELTVVANATGLVPDRPDLHAPVARIPEVAGLFAESRRGGLVAGSGRLDVFHHLRAPDEASFAGGVFVVVRCQDRTSWDMLAAKGHVVSDSGETAMLYLPRHILGLEAATSVLDAAGLGRSGYGDDYRPRIDLVALAERDLAAGTVLTASGHHHTIEGVRAEMHPAAPLAGDQPAPFYLVADRPLVRPVRAGEPIRLRDVGMDEASTLFALRLRQDALFA
ncbi:flagellar biosynthesis protein FlgA [Phreatobacter sp. AB_2022a]|uniref:flagellar biosynthesis protein FlgA n=1 Tax=Phreatobacter sp. AB_2022a TaxID=3003134 RepID=UPI0022872CC4|nr:flagellar biosynthesis protein FlgA [Phreatobacter sp. AB_2022a]MCZ0735341.1 flagellar biosynthesis protein FlgA [Phreatobacter sp. AB_2022a]